MNKERIKTYLLIILFVTSIFLVKKVWIEIPFGLTRNVNNEVLVENKNMLSEIISPERYIIDFGNHYTVLYSDKGYNLWDSTSEILKTSLEEQEVEVELIETDNKAIFNKTTTYIEMNFSIKIPTHIFLKTLDIKESNDIYKQIENIENIYIPIKNGGNFIILSDGEKHFKISSSKFNMRDIKTNVEKLEKSDYTRYYTLSEIWLTDSKGYMPLAVDSITPIYVSTEIDLVNNKLMESIAKTLFAKDFDYVRKIEENNGSKIYVYNNERGLKISEDGVINYFNSLNRKVMQRNLYTSLKTAVDFISKTGWPEDTYLKDIEEIEFDGSLGYRLIFDYRIGGKKIIFGSSKMDNGIEIEVFNTEIKTYKRFVREIDINKLIGSEKISVLAPDKIISMSENFNIIKESYMDRAETKGRIIDEDQISAQILSSINDIYPAYYDPCNKDYVERLISVWVIDIEDMIYIFDASDGKFRVMIERNF